MRTWEFLIINYNPRNLFFYSDLTSYTPFSFSRLNRHFEKVKCSNFTWKFSVSKFKLRFRMQNCSRTFFMELKIIFKLFFSIYSGKYTFIRIQSMVVIGRKYLYYSWEERSHIITPVVCGGAGQFEPQHSTLEMRHRGKVSSALAASPGPDRSYNKQPAPSRIISEH